MGFPLMSLTFVAIMLSPAATPCAFVLHRAQDVLGKWEISAVAIEPVLSAEE